MSATPPTDVGDLVEPAWNQLVQERRIAFFSRIPQHATTNVNPVDTPVGQAEVHVYRDRQFPRIVGGAVLVLAAKRHLSEPGFPADSAAAYRNVGSVDGDDAAV